jgi:hypothetical protein
MTLGLQNTATSPTGSASYFPESTSMSAEAVWESILNGLHWMKSAMISVENTDLLLEEWL